MFDAQKFLEDYSIPISTSGKNTQPGWINIKCPFCYDNSNHGGFNIIKGYYNCWQCGHHSLYDVISKLTGENPKQILYNYSTRYLINKKLNKKKAPVEKLKIPGSELTKQQRKYLINRNFDPDFLIEKYKIKGTGPTGAYSFRIIAPIFYKNKAVSYQSRDTTNKQKLRYKACSKDKEIIHHQNKKNACRTHIFLL